MSSYLRQCWTPPAQPQGTLPQGDQHQCPWVLQWPLEQKSWAREASFGHTQASGYLPADITMNNYVWWYCPNQPFALSNPGVGNSWGSHCPYCPAIQDSYWDWHEHPLQWSTLITRGDVKDHGVTTHNWGIHRCPSQKRRYWTPNCLPSERGPNHGSH